MNKKILGINYSGYHDTSIALADSQGNILCACSLERISREKQDGRTPETLFQNIDFSEIEEIVLTTNKVFEKKEYQSILHPNKLLKPRDVEFRHQNAFYAFIDTLPIQNIRFIDHEKAHAASAFWLSGFDEAVCLVYDGGMFNCNIFGGIYRCSKQSGVHLIDGFDINQYSKITTLYTVTTAMLGFTPNKHEGKITGLAAYGKYNDACINLLNFWFTEQYDKLESTLEWLFSYSKDINPVFYKNKEQISLIQKSFEAFDKETIAYNLQHLAEMHILKILDNMNANNFLNKNICLAGGLFANVKINQKIADYKNFKFENIFIAPPMGDEGTALGAVLERVNQKYNVTHFDDTMYLGFSYSKQDIIDTLNALHVKYTTVENPSEIIANILANGNEIALFDLKMEFGPRALGARSILAPANDKTVNERLNKKLNRTEFMPFAPMTLEEYLAQSYINFGNKTLAMKFMTIACECTSWMQEKMPAVVHIDNTARPQIITGKQAFLYEMMHCYHLKTGLSSIVNTSFNIHEEPIINTPSEAVQGFLISGLAYLFFKEADILVRYDDNQELALSLVKKRMLNHKPKEAYYKKLLTYFEEQNMLLKESLNSKENVIQELSQFVDKTKKQIKIYEDNTMIKIMKKLGLMK